MTTPEHPQFRRIHGVKCLLVALIAVSAIFYLATEVYPKMGWEFGLLEGVFLGLSVVIFLFGFWEFVTNRTILPLFSKLDKIKWWQWTLIFFVCNLLVFGSIIAYMLIGFRR